MKRQISTKGSAIDYHHRKKKETNNAIGCLAVAPGGVCGWNDRNNNHNNNDLIIFANMDKNNPNDRISREPTPTETEALLVKELNQLTLQERERVMDEIHGVADSEEEETPDFVAMKLRLIQEEIVKIRKRSAYERALFLAPHRVKDPAFLLMFLRSESYNAKKAATRLIHYFECKLEYFGFDKLVEPITLNDLDEDDLFALRNGCLQLSPVKDRAGRGVILKFQKNYNYRSIRSQVCAAIFGIHI